MAIQASIPHLHNSDSIQNSGLQWMMEGNGLLQNDSFQFQPQQQQQQQQQMWVPSASPLSLLPTPTTTLAAAGSLDHPVVGSSYQLLLQNVFEKQRKEIDLYVRQEVLSNRFMAVVHQQQKQQLGAILLSMEAKASSILTQKDSELEKVKQRTMELELCLRLIEEEKETWQRIAKENDAMAISLNNTLERVREPHFSSTANGAAAALEGEQAASCSGFGREAETSAKGRKRCRVCGRGEARAVLLPCRHLCCCLPCAASVDACPLCASPKRNSVEVFLE